MRYLEETTQWVNLVENYIGIFKEAIRQDLIKTNALLVVLDYCAKWRVRVYNLAAKVKFYMENIHPVTCVIGDVSNVLNIHVHKLYDIVWFRE